MSYIKLKINLFKKYLKKYIFMIYLNKLHEIKNEFSKEIIKLILK